VAQTSITLDISINIKSCVTKSTVDPTSIISQLIKHSRSAHKASKSRPFY